MGAVVVERTQQHTVVEVGRPTQRPGFEVVGFAPGGRDRAASGATSSIADP
jgi:hypothetical protein